MKDIIVTLIDDSNKFELDVQMPNDQPIESMIDDLIGTINQYLNREYFGRTNLSFTCKRTGKTLDISKTLLENGVINGDYVYILEG